MTKPAGYCRSHGTAIMRTDAATKGFFPLRRAPFRSRVSGAFFSLSIEDSNAEDTDTLCP